MTQATAGGKTKQKPKAVPLSSFVASPPVALALCLPTRPGEKAFDLALADKLSLTAQRSASDSPARDSSQQLPASQRAPPQQQQGTAVSDRAPPRGDGGRQHFNGGMPHSPPPPPLGEPHPRDGCYAGNGPPHQVVFGHPHMYGGPHGMPLPPPPPPPPPPCGGRGRYDRPYCHDPWVGPYAHPGDVLPPPPLPDAPSQYRPRRGAGGHSPSPGAFPPGGHWDDARVPPPPPPPPPRGSGGGPGFDRGYHTMGHFDMHPPLPPPPPRSGPRHGGFSTHPLPHHDYYYGGPPVHYYGPPDMGLHPYEGMPPPPPPPPPRGRLPPAADHPLPPQPPPRGRQQQEQQQDAGGARVQILQWPSSVAHPAAGNHDSSSGSSRAGHSAMAPSSPVSSSATAGRNSSPASAGPLLPFSSSASPAGNKQGKQGVAGHGASPASPPSADRAPGASPGAGAETDAGAPVAADEQQQQQVPVVNVATPPPALPLLQPPPVAPTELPLLADTPLQAQQPSGAVRNEFAERLAQQALARLASRTAGLPLSQGSGASLTLAPAGCLASGTDALLASGTAEIVPATSSPTAAPSPTRSGAVGHEGPAVGDSVALPGADRSGGEVTIREALPVPAQRGETEVGGRPRLQLRPRTLPLEAAGGAGLGVPLAGQGGSGLAAGEELGGARKPLHLQPRSSSSTKDTATAPDSNPPAAPLAPASGSSRLLPSLPSPRRQRPPPPTVAKPALAHTPPAASSVFGQARPREEVLRERGLEAAVDLADLPRSSSGSFGHGSAHGTAHHGYAPAPGGSRGSRAGSVASGYSDEHRHGDQWQTVGGAKQRGVKQQLQHLGSRGNEVDDPLLGAFNHGPTRFFDGPVGGGGGYRPPYAAGGGFEWDYHYRQGGAGQQ